MFDLYLLDFRMAIDRAMKAESDVVEVVKWLRDQTKNGISLSHKDCCLLADLLDVKRKRGRPRTRKNGVPAGVFWVDVMGRYAHYCLDIGWKDGPTDRDDAKARTCKDEGICKRDFEVIHAKHGSYAVDIEKRLKGMIDKIRKEISENDSAR